MSNVIEYAKKYGDFTFFEEEFNVVDAAILSLLSYVDFIDIVNQSKKGLPLKNVLDYFLSNYDLKLYYKRGISKKNIIKLCRIIKDKDRYKDILLYNYVYKIGFDEQFGAITMRLPNKLVVVSFEGTNHNLVGWEEDFTMCYKYPVPCEIDAVNYINQSVSLLDKDVIVLGHSKGGHLSMIAGMMASLPVRLKIKKIYNFDGPGLRKNIIESRKYKRIIKKLKYIVPNHSIVGLLLRHSEDIRVVKSTRKDLHAHSIFYWEVADTSFCETSLSRLSKNLDYSISVWLDNHEDSEREIIIKAIFEYLRKNGIKDVNNLVKIKTLFTLLKNSKELDKETRNVIRDFIKFNFDYHVNSIKEEKKFSE